MGLHFDALQGPGDHARARKKQHLQECTRENATMQAASERSQAKLFQSGQGTLLARTRRAIARALRAPLTLVARRITLRPGTSSSRVSVFIRRGPALAPCRPRVQRRPATTSRIAARVARRPPVCTMPQPLLRHLAVAPPRRHTHGVCTGRGSSVGVPLLPGFQQPGDACRSVARVAEGPEP